MEYDWQPQGLVRNATGGNHTVILFSRVGGQNQPKISQHIYIYMCSYVHTCPRDCLYVTRYPRSLYIFFTSPDFSGTWFEPKPCTAASTAKGEEHTHQRLGTPPGCQDDSEKNPHVKILSRKHRGGVKPTKIIAL